MVFGVEFGTVMADGCLEWVEEPPVPAHDQNCRALEYPTMVVGILLVAITLTGISGCGVADELKTSPEKSVDWRCSNSVLERYLPVPE
jgi:hypothetical protein